MITIRDTEYPYSCNACRENKAVKEIEFRTRPNACGGTVISLCKDCVKELVKEVVDELAG